jgi:hypothetical protein
MDLSMVRQSWGRQTAASVRLFHGVGQVALATYRTAAAVGKLSSSVLRLLA